MIVRRKFRANLTYEGSKRMIRLLTIICVTLLLVPMRFAYGHTALKSSLPISGSILEKVPDELVLTFQEPTRLTSLVVVSPTGETSLKFAPEGSAEVFKSLRPVLDQGRNEVRWRALSKDGHVVEGTIVFTIRMVSP
jgi:methionine-rich copper-binding protein CopC